MPKCQVCGKRFDSITALRDHHNAVHRGTAFIAPTVSSTRKITAIIIIVIIVVSSAAGYLIYMQLTNGSGSTTSQLDSLIGQQISPQLYQNLTGVSNSTLSSVGDGGSAHPTSITGSSLTLNGKPEILYIGGEYCPYCAAERWSLVVALFRFGTFSNLSYMLSSSSDIYPNTATLTFYGSNYTSKYISFISVEHYTRAGNTAILQPLSSEEQALWSQYGGGSIPFIDIAGNYVVSGSQYTPPTISGLNWTQIGSQLNNPSSAVAKSIDGAANTLISAICKVNGGQPSSICTSSYAQLLVAKLPGSSSFLMVSTYDPFTSSSTKLALERLNS